MSSVYQNNIYLLIALLILQVKTKQSSNKYLAEAVGHRGELP